MTRLFRDGHIRLLVGTQALLGEGWDAPSINTLVLASNVGSYMLSNQMRGRAIRTDPADPAKVANIWHLATVEPDEPVAPVLRRFRWTDTAAAVRPDRAASGPRHGVAQASLPRLCRDRRRRRQPDRKRAGAARPRRAPVGR